ncbi:MAG: DNA-directed RNA polymerase subunit omega [Oscillospiraceae bacterium]|nr:DNA-directed RNA polymerase subunit omega [Oscillospiraceae bacterium]
MLKPSMSQMAVHGESYYSVVVGIAKRARAIADEQEKEKEKNKKIPDEKPVALAVDELAQRKFTIIEDPSVKPTKTVGA